MNKQTVIKFYVGRYHYYEVLNADNVKDFTVKNFDQFHNNGKRVIWTTFHIPKSGNSIVGSVLVNETYEMGGWDHQDKCYYSKKSEDFYTVPKSHFTVKIVITRSGNEYVDIAENIRQVMKAYGFEKIETEIKL